LLDIAQRDAGEADAPNRGRSRPDIALGDARVVIRLRGVVCIASSDEREVERPRRYVAESIAEFFG
jgi:hypothetical protein